MRAFQHVPAKPRQIRLERPAARLPEPDHRWRVLNDNRENPSPSDAATVDGARYNIISILGKRVTLVTSRSVDVVAQV